MGSGLPAGSEIVIERHGDALTVAPAKGLHSRSSFRSVSLVVVLLGTGLLAARTVSLGLGIGRLGYSVFWLRAGSRVPSLGSTGAAKESLAWLAIPASGMVVASTAAVALLIVGAMMRRDESLR